MKTEWDYTDLAEAYLKRPDYAQTAIDKMLQTAGVKKGDAVCDVGAGAAHLTLKLAEYGLRVSAVEPNDAMRANGIKRTEKYSDVIWFEGVGEHTGMESNKFEMVTFGSSFNVCNRQEALQETGRILKDGGWFACMWNHRDLEDPLQKEIENILKKQIPGYRYGSRREDQTEVIKQSGLFDEVVYIEGSVVHEMLAEDFIEGWKSHGTVQRQSKERFDFINQEIRKAVEAKKKTYIRVPYTTRIWMAQLKERGAKIMLGTKAETLQTIFGRIHNGKVLPQISFTVGEWNLEQETILERYEQVDWKGNVIVRSSSLSEDTVGASQAGKYESVANVRGLAAFKKAVEDVVASYDDGNNDNQVLVQPMLQDVSLCGVAFTLEPNTMGNYYVINYDITGSTDAVTSGQGKDSRLYYWFKGADVTAAPQELKPLICALQELEEFFGQDNLDVEFAVDGTGELYILQVRTLCIGTERMDFVRQKKELGRIHNKIQRDQSPKPFLCGNHTVYSVMTDWNPAEMIGIRPKPLAMSLYQEIITDSVWAYQRDNYGYRNLRSFPLMVDFCGLPYIDVRVSFNSFVPAELDEEISRKLVDYYLDRLLENPEKHDKAEFEIVFSCYTLDLPERIQILQKYGFTEEEIGKILDSLRNVTNQIIDHEGGLWRKDAEKIKILEQRYEDILASDMGKIEKIYWLLEDCKRYGTLPFAGLARAAFIAVQILRSLVSCSILSERDYELFMNGVNSVSSGMNADFKELSKNAFLKKYGHLRPGTYDISSARYDEAPDLYFNWQEREGDVTESELFRLSLKQLNRLKDKLEENGLRNDVLELMDFIKRVIEGREYGKFVFTKNLSKVLQLIGEIGEEEGFAKEECAFINIQTIRGLYASTRDIRTNLKETIEHGKADYEMTQIITLPPFLARAEEVFGFFYPDSEPNFITSGKVSGEVCYMENALRTMEISDKIVLIPSADPGYDWIFSHGIQGFITMYGGANSHMAIRAGELGIPAAVGVGGKDFERYRKAKVLEIDALSRLIRVLK